MELTSVNHTTDPPTEIEWRVQAKPKMARRLLSCAYITNRSSQYGGSTISLAGQAGKQKSEIEWFLCTICYCGGEIVRKTRFSRTNVEPVKGISGLYERCACSSVWGGRPS